MKLLARLEGVYVQSVCFLCISVCIWTYMYVNVSETKREAETET